MKFLLPLSCLVASFALAAQAEEAARFVDGDGFRELHIKGKPVLRHMNAFDPARRDETNKPYLHVYGFHDDGLITKGPGGQFTHHRGLFIGWNKTTLDGKALDFWHCRNVERRHMRYLPDQEEVKVGSGRMVSVTDWPAPDGKVVVRETQRVTATKLSEKALQLDFDFSLEAPSGPVELKGDAQHAGFHFRAAEEVEKSKGATYVRAPGAKDEKNDIWSGTPWVLCQFDVKGKKYAVMHMSSPANPQPITYSTRNYGRFGAFSTPVIAADKPLSLRYRVLIQDASELPDKSPEALAKIYDQFGTAP